MTVPTNGSKYDMSVNPVYQVNWQHEQKGKRIAGTKRRVRFSFGFSDGAAVAAGEIGPACRGEEHDIVLVWSLTSGKRIVTMDEKEVHFSQGNLTENRFETSWSMAGGHIIKLIAHASPPLFTPEPGFKQFDLLLDGCSFFNMPHIYELGKAGNKNARSIVPTNNSNYALPPSAERRSSARPSLSDHRVGAGSEPALLASPANKRSSPPTRVTPPRSKSLDELDFLDSPPCPPAITNTLMPSTPNDEFAPQAAPDPTFDSISNQIMSTYAPAPAVQSAAAPVLALANESHTYGFNDNNHSHVVSPHSQQGYYQQQPAQPSYYQEPAPQSQSYYQQPVQQLQPTMDQHVVPAPPTLTMERLSVEELELREINPANPFERAVKSLVNIDDISAPLQTPEQRKMLEKRTLNQPLKSQALPPSKPAWNLGLQPRLGDIKENTQPKTAPSKEIMRTHAFDPAAAQAGMMVPYGTTTMSPAGFNGYPMQQPPQQQQQVGFYHQQPMMYAS